MMNTVAIVLGAITALGSCCTAGCKYYEDTHRKPEVETVVPPQRPNTPATDLEKMVEQIIKEDSDVSIKISIHTHHDKKDESHVDNKHN